MEDIEKDLLRAVKKDTRFGDDIEAKLAHFAPKFPMIVKDHPISLIYSCILTDDVNDCAKLVSKLSDYNNHPRTDINDEDILKLVDHLMSVKDSNVVDAIYEAETRHLDIILGIPLIFFKVCNERDKFNRDQLIMMLDYKKKVTKNEMTQHDASVKVGTILVDKYVKSKLA